MSYPKLNSKDLDSLGYDKKSQVRRLIEEFAENN